MAGHSKWANIRFRKAAQDAKKGKVFTKLIREITVSARLAGDDLSNNPRLRDAINKALKANMKRDTIDNAIKRGTGGEDGSIMEELRYEGYGIQGVAILVDCLSDNKNRTVSEVRHTFSKYNGNLSTTGSVAYLFRRCGQISFPSGVDEEQLLEIALEAGAEDVINHSDTGIDVITEVDQLYLVQQALIDRQFNPEQAEITMLSDNKIAVEGDNAKHLLTLLDALEDLDDVQHVYCNADIPLETILNNTD